MTTALKHGKACPLCHGLKTRQVPTEPGYGILEKWACDKCEIAWYVRPGQRSRDIFGQFNIEMARVALANARKAYKPHKPKQPPKTSQRATPNGLDKPRDGRLIVRGPNGQAWGYIKDRIYVRYGDQGSKHKFNSLDAWAIDANIFEKLIRPSCQVIIVIDKEAGWRYRISVADFDANKGEFDYGHGRQYFVVLERWTKFQ